MRKSNPRRSVAALVVLAAASVASAQEVGKFAVVQNDVTSLRPGATDAVEAEVGAPIVLNESEITGRASRAKFVFGEGAVISIGQNTTFEVSQQAVDQATGRSSSKVDVARGKLRVFVSRFWGGRPEVEVNTPTAVVGIKGTDVLVEVFDGRTTVTVFGGTAEVRARSGGGTSQVRAAQQVDVSGSTGVGTPVVLDAEVLGTLWMLTEPQPQIPADLPKQLPIRDTPDPAAAVAGLTATECTTCNGSSVIVDPPVRGTRDVPSTPGEPINSGSKSGSNR